MCTGSDGSVDFDYVRINEESRQTVHVKNKGKFDIGYMWATVHFCLYYTTAQACLLHRWELPCDSLQVQMQHSSVVKVHN